MSKSIFDVVGQAPDDPILGLNEAFKSDPRDKKVNLSIGVYSTEDGKVPLLRVVAEAEKRILEAGELILIFRSPVFLLLTPAFRS